MKTAFPLPPSQSDFIYTIEVIHWGVLFLTLIYFISSILAIRWILRHDIMDNFQKTVHIICVLLLPVFWFYLIRMIYKPIPGYKKRRWGDTGTDADSGGGADYGTDMGGHDGGGDGGGD